MILLVSLVNLGNLCCYLCSCPTLWYTFFYACYTDEAIYILSVVVLELVNLVEHNKISAMCLTCLKVLKPCKQFSILVIFRAFSMIPGKLR